VSPHRAAREKVFGSGRSIPLDRNQKVRIATYARAWNARHKEGRQHKGPMTRAFLDVLEALLWGFHNSRSGCCFPSYEAIAEKAGCARSTVAEALKVLEWAGLLTWQHRIARIRERCRDLFGHDGWRWRVIRTSNAYTFRDPQAAFASKSENPTGTPVQEDSKPRAASVGAPTSPLECALARFGAAIAAVAPISS
jgi:Helix-turn-helix domain